EEIRSREEILQAREDSLCRLADIFIGRVNNATTVSDKTARVCGFVTPLSNMDQAFFGQYSCILWKRFTIKQNNPVFESTEVKFT
ncbi:MAG: hypothetical protein N0E45_13360, partial [Candidatus Thiodiazotropha endolucinida]|nr:hypothetical protein [Candidatus Thiodiazotropha taylori]MCW4300625.1 hypothetical protein [Candidatus Thiodiazotropha endolucinida]